MFVTVEAQEPECFPFNEAVDLVGMIGRFVCELAPPFSIPITCFADTKLQCEICADNLYVFASNIYGINHCDFPNGRPKCGFNGYFLPEPGENAIVEVGCPRM